MRVILDQREMPGLSAFRTSLSTVVKSNHSGSKCPPHQRLLRRRVAAISRACGISGQPLDTKYPAVRETLGGIAASMAPHLGAQRRSRRLRSSSCSPSAVTTSSAPATARFFCWASLPPCAARADRARPCTRDLDQILAAAADRPIENRRRRRRRRDRHFPVERRPRPVRSGHSKPGPG